MRKYINKLREKPEHKRKQIALIASCGCMVVIIGVWLMTFSIRFSGLYALTKHADANETNLVDDNSQVAGAASPFDALKNNLNNTFSNNGNSNDSSDTNAQISPGVEITSAPSEYNSESGYVSNGVIITDPTQH